MNRVFIRKDREGYIDSVLVSQYVLSDGRRIVGFYRAFKDEKTYEPAFKPLQGNTAFF